LNHHPLEPIYKLYLEEKDIAKQSKDLYETILRQFVEYLKDKRIEFASKSDITNYFKWKKSQVYSNNWLYLQISTIKAFYQYLSANQKRLNLPSVYAYDITESIKNVSKKPRVSKPVLTVQQAKQLLVSTKEKRKYIWQYRNYAIIYLMITTGLRSVEIRRARKKDLRVVGKQLILYVQGKGRKSKDEFVKITQGVEEAINDYLKRRKDKNPYLFVSHSHHTDKPYLSRTFFLGMLKSVLKESDLEVNLITPHSLRHTAATFNLLRGGTLESTSKLMRHANIQTTLTYSHHLEYLKDDSVNEIESYILKESEIKESEKSSLKRLERPLLVRKKSRSSNY